MLRIVTIVLMLTFSVPASYAVGALARNPRSNDSVIVVNKPNAQSAEHDALLACGDDCEIVRVFQNSCMAYAADHRQNSTAYGYAQAANARAAGERALESCQASGGSCTVMASDCDR